MQKAPCKKSLRGSSSGKRGYCFREGCVRGTEQLSKQAPVFVSVPSFLLLQSQLSPALRSKSPSANILVG